MKRCAIAILGWILCLQAALAAEPVFPPASRIGIVPPQDMAVSLRFSGFENEEKAAAINLLRNAFVAAFTHSLEGTVSLEDVETGDNE